MNCPPRADFIPAGSYLKDWIAVQQDYFGAAGTAVDIYWTRSRGDSVRTLPPVFGISLTLFHVNAET